MAYDEKLAERIRDVLRGRRGVSEKKMFGGLSFLVRGNMSCGILDKRLLVRVGPERYEKSLSRRYVSPMDFTGKPLNGYVYVAPEGIRSRAQLSSWVEKGLEFAGSLPAKKKT